MEETVSCFKNSVWIDTPEIHVHAIILLAWDHITLSNLDETKVIFCKTITTVKGLTGLDIHWYSEERPDKALADYILLLALQHSPGVSGHIEMQGIISH